MTRTEKIVAWSNVVVAVCNIATTIVLIVTLLSAYKQYKVSTDSTKAATYSQIVDQNLHLNEVLLQRGEAHIKNYGYNDLDDLLANSFIDHYENVFIQHQLINLPSSVWPGWKKYMKQRIQQSKPLMAAYQAGHDEWDNDFVAYIDAKE